MSQNRENELRRLITEIRMMENSVALLQQRLQYLNQAVAELSLANGSLQQLRDVPESNPILFPIGGGAYVKAELGRLNKIVVGIGADVSVEMDYADALENVNARFEQMDAARASVDQQLSQIITQLEAHQARVERLSAELQGAT